jgi:hypothetical protein
MLNMAVFGRNLVSRFEEPKVDDEVIRKRRNGTLEFCGNA